MNGPLEKNIELITIRNEIQLYSKLSPLLLRPLDIRQANNENLVDLRIEEFRKRKETDLLLARIFSLNQEVPERHTLQHCRRIRGRTRQLGRTLRLEVTMRLRLGEICAP